MKKPYTTPAVLTNGAVVDETMTIEPGAGEPVALRKKDGSIGFNL